MKRIGPVFFCLLCFMILLSSPARGADGLQSEVLRNFQRSVVKTLLSGGKMIRIAVLDIEGDDGTIKNAIISAINEKTTLKVIERGDLDKILKEQGLQLKDIADSRTRIRHGRIKGVQGLLMGKTGGVEEGFLSSRLKTQLKLVDVEKGEVVFAKELSVEAVSPWRTRLSGITIAAFASLAGLTVLTRRRGARRKASIREDMRVRADLTREIDKALINLSEARARLMAGNRPPEAVLVKDAERNLLFLRDRIENAPKGNSGALKAGDLRTVLNFDRGFKDTCDSLGRSTRRIYENANSEDTDHLKREVVLLKRDIETTAKAFLGRGF